MSTCTEALYLETGCLDISSIIKGRRVKYLHYMVNSDKQGMLFKFFRAQWEFPTKGDWSEQCKDDLLDLDLPINLDYFEGRPQEAFKTMVNKKTKEYALDKFITMKIPHSKLDN